TCCALADAALRVGRFSPRRTARERGRAAGSAKPGPRPFAHENALAPHDPDDRAGPTLQELELRSVAAARAAPPARGPSGPIGQRKRRVIEGGSLLLRPTVGEPVGQEVDQRGLLARGEVARLNPLGLLRVREVTAPAVEVDHVTERRLRTVVEVGCG